MPPRGWRKGAMPSDDLDPMNEHDQSAGDAPRRRAASDDEMPNLIVPVNRTPTIDLSDPSDCPDQPDGEWSKAHLGRFLAKQPRTMVMVPKESWEPKGEDTYLTVGYCGHWFRVVKNKPVMVPLQIGAIIEQSQREFPTTQAQNKRWQLTDIRDLPDTSRGRGAGVEIFV